MTTLSEHLSRLGKKGGKARAQNMTREERAEAARKAVQARWKKQDERLQTVVDEITVGTKALIRRQKRQAKTKKRGS